MLPVLHPEILHNIIRHACKDDDGSVTSKRERQRDLAALMAVSKIFNELCTIEMYQDCLIHRPQTFFKTLFPAQKWYSDRLDTDIKFEGSPNTTKQDQLSRVKTLRVCQSPSIAEADYWTLLTDAPFCWATAGTLRYPNDPSLPYNQTDRFVHDAKACCDFSIWIRRVVRMGYPVLPSLEKVVMLGGKDDAISTTLNQFAKGFPDSLLNLPSVQYYCQNSLFGPYTLRNSIAKTYHPPKVATFHIADPDICSNWAETLPVILGATNRYILSCPVKIAAQYPRLPPMLMIVGYKHYRLRSWQ